MNDESLTTTPEVLPPVAPCRPSKASALRAFAATIPDPVFRGSLVRIAQALELSTRFKRIDIAFLQIRGSSNIPKFAILPYRDFQAGRTCTLNSLGYMSESWGSQYRFQELVPRDLAGDYNAHPRHVVPETIAAIVLEAEPLFDEIMIAWEADWQPGNGDPIVLGRLGAYYFVVATWDLTDLETFVVNSMQEEP